MSFSGTTPLVGSMIAGKYRLIRRLGVGGMGDVYLARVEGLAGFEKHVAVKLLHEHLVGEEMVMESFLAEARLAANLNHANIAQLYDLGQSDGMYFIAMEYVSGLDLRALMAEAAKRDERLPIPLCCYVAARLCDGLDHAHRKRDGSGRPLKLVHRDVSPSNCLVSFGGEVKLIDFGIAKAAGEDRRTRTGMIKGKTAYLSPEQVQGWPLDRRSDIFSAGIVLYELLCGPRPFQGESEFSVMEAIRDVRYMPPTQLDPDLPSGLNAIVVRSLAKDPQARYQWASEMVTDIEGYLFSRGELISARDVAEYIKGLVGGSRVVQAAEILSPDPEPPTGSTRSLRSRSRIRAQPSPEPAPPVLPPEVGTLPAGPSAMEVIAAAEGARAEATQVTATPAAPVVPTEVGPPPARPHHSGPHSRVRPVDDLPDDAPSRLPVPPGELGVASAATHTMTAASASATATAAAAPALTPLRVSAVLAVFALSGAAGYVWHRLSQEPAAAPEPAAVAAAPSNPEPAATPEPAAVAAAPSNSEPAPATAPEPAVVAAAPSTPEPAPAAASAPPPPPPVQVKSTEPEPTTVTAVKPAATDPGPAAPETPVARAKPLAPAPAAAAPGTTTVASAKPAHPAPHPTSQPSAPKSGATAPREPPRAAAPVRSDAAYLNLRSNRPSEIVIDGKSAGRSPQVHFAIPPGRHEIRFDCIYDWGKATGEVQSLYLVPMAEGDVTHECVEIARP